MSTEAPGWFRRAIDHPFASRRVEVRGCSIHYLAWEVQRPEPARPALLFVHGGGAHAHWWRFVAPFFVRDYRPLALDLSGMGDSGRREAYSTDERVAEIRAVLAHAGAGSRPLVVGHSLGGFVSMRLGAHHGEELGGVVIVDSPIRRPGAPSIDPPPPPRKHRIYGRLEDALARFRVLPDQPCENDYVLDFVARHSLVRVEDEGGGWRWKFDPAAMHPRRFGQPFHEHLERLRCRAALVYGERSALVDQETADYMSEVMGPRAPVVGIPEAHHHVMLDQPLAFVAALRALLEVWLRTAD